MSSLGSLLGGGGKNSFRAQQATLDETKYGPANEETLNLLRQQLQAGSTAQGGQRDLVAALQARARGEGPSLTQQQLQAATDQNIAQTAGQVASMKGISPALAARVIAQQRGEAGQQMAGQAATARLQEQMGAEQQLAAALEAQRQQDLAQQQVTTGALGTIGGLQGAQNQARIGNVSQANQTNAQVAAQNAKTGGSMLGGLLGAAGGVLGTMVAPGVGTALGSSLGSAVGSAMAEGGEVDFRGGGKVPGAAEVEGDSPENDTVPSWLSPGEVVIKRSVAQKPGVKDALLKVNDNPDLAKDFVAAIKAKSRGKDGSGYGKVLASQRDIEKRIAALEQRFADGGEVEEEGGEDESKGLMGSLAKWWKSKGDETGEAAQAVDRAAVESTTGMVARTSAAVDRRKAALAAALRSAEGN